MIKKLLSFGAIVVATAATAQTNGKKAAQAALPESVQNTIVSEKTLASSCATLTPITGTTMSLYTASSDTQTPGCSPKAGYVYGSNCYGDKEKANFFGPGAYSSVGSPTITGVVVAFYKHLTMGTSGTTSTIGINIYSGTSNTAAPSGAAMGGTTAPLAQVISAQTNTANSMFYYTFNLTTPVIPPATGFFASVILPTSSSTGDTAVVFSQSATVNNTWEKQSNGNWFDMSVSWGLKGNISVFPIICGNITAGISANTTLAKRITILPNPSAGLVNVFVTLNQPENISLTVTNTLGQQVLSGKYDGISNDQISLDLSNHPNGVYFITVSNGTDKMVQRLILNK